MISNISAPRVNMKLGKNTKPSFQKGYDETIKGYRPPSFVIVSDYFLPRSVEQLVPSMHVLENKRPLVQEPCILSDRPQSLY